MYLLCMENKNFIILILSLCLGISVVLNFLPTSKSDTYSADREIAKINYQTCMTASLNFSTDVPKTAVFIKSFMSQAKANCQTEYDYLKQLG